MRLLVTGAAGHLGSHLIPALLAAGFEVTGFDIAQPAKPPACRFVTGDLSNITSLKSALESAELIAHCAAIHPWKTYSDDQYLDANIKGTWHLYHAAAELGISRVVLTSSIAAAGYSVPVEQWPINEEQQFPLSDLYSLTKHTQEDIARMFADAGKVRTIALRPPAFMPKSQLETGFNLTGAFALVDDIVAAHIAAARVQMGEHFGEQQTLRPFEAFFVTNKLPYSAEDAAACGFTGDVQPLVKKYWPQAYEWLLARGYQGVHLPTVYDISKARRMLGWQPVHNFEQWFAAQAKD
ncbi:MAG TPA: NAD(P)-dependent oxidoreductase [Abditibacteriaceae bacterium]|nr:NAD(P)-dependent oxidoreductase [Abditibacteriaceae bacterium]